jgi:hypothetical protein
MIGTILIVSSYLIAFLLGRLWGIVEAKERIMKILKEYKTK